MRKLFFFFCILCFALSPVRAQYATSGTGLIRGHIWWFDWAGLTLQNGASRTFTTTDGLTVRIDFSGVTGTAMPDRMNTWSGAVLHNLYDFTDPAVMPALHSRASSTAVTFTMNITVTRNGVPAPFTFIGGEAEASNEGETTRLITSGGAWNRIENFNNSSLGMDPLTRCGTTDIEIANTYGGSAGRGQNPLMATNGTGSLTVTASMERRQPRQGGMAVAFGIFGPVDMGDLPSTYGFAHHRLSFIMGNGCNYPADPPAMQSTSLVHLGNAAADPDAMQSTDDNTSGADEDGLTVFPQYNGSTGQYSVDIALTNLSGNNAYLSAWIDINRDGVFSNSEAITKVVAPNATTENFTWLNLPYILPASFIGQQNFALRFRISSNQAAVQMPTGAAPDGEIEDYFFPIVQVCLITKVNAGADQSICHGRSANLQASGALTYNWLADNDLSDLLVPDPTVITLINKTYYLSAQHANGCVSKDTIAVTVISPPVFTVTPQHANICLGDTVSFTANGGDRMDWLDAQDNYLGTANIFSAWNIPAGTIFRVAFVDNRCNVRDTLNIPITVSTGPQTFVTKSNDLDCGTGRALLNVFGGETYRWMPGPGITDLTRSTQWVTPDTSRSYYVLATDQNGCSRLDSIRVNVNTESGFAHYLMPTAFTPNRDGNNDCFGIKYPGVIHKLDFTVYDRWGKVMFHTNSVNDCWDGTFKGVPMDINTYVYVFRIESPCGRIERKGTITLLR